MNAQNTSLATLEDNRIRVAEQLVSARSMLEPVLPKHVSFDAVRSAFNAYARRNLKLFECSPSSIFWAFVQACELGLSVSDVLGEAYILGYENRKNPGGPKTARFIPGYKGLIKLAYQSSLIARVDAYVIYEKDRFVPNLGRNEVEYIPCLAGSRGNVIAVYTQIELSTIQAAAGQRPISHRIMALDALERIRHSSPGSQQPASPWNTHTAAMYLKTGLREALKYQPKSNEAERAIRLEEQADMEDAPEVERIEALEPPGRAAPAAGNGRAARSRARVVQQAAEPVGPHDEDASPPDPDGDDVMNGRR